ncbi:hypothetical protein [uncultured Psychroserpens sp.]|uniref:hypothetical protein n=1 Tax=uncultured Psychroserpens sp. TaxID=255436 RepID=UPI0026368F39|nr:hypothetical protein [uncultured Psychroserpens sp.]
MLEGIIITDREFPIVISTIDTLSVYWKDKKTKRFDSLSKNNQNVTKTDSNGFFRLSAYENDSIYIKSFNHISQSFSVTDYLKLENQNITLKPCDWEFECKNPNEEFFVFIAEKISLEMKIPEQSCNVLMDRQFIAKYKVLENLYGDIQKDSVTFYVFDHYGWPKFKDYEKLVLYVNKYCDIYVHEKYQYQPLLKTKNGKLASPFLNDDFRYLKTDFPIKPRRMDFENPVIFEHEKLDSIEGIKQMYPEPYFRIEENKVFALYGNDINELFELKKLTILKSRGKFN